MEAKKKNNRNNIKKLFILLTLIMCVITLYEIMSAYAVFHSETLGITETDLAQWKMVINDTDISSGTTEEFVIDTFYPENSTKVAEDKIAPGLLGYFEIILEPKTTQVSIRYDISIDVSHINNDKLSLTSVQEIEEDNELIETIEDTYTGIIPLSVIDGEYVNNIRITFQWENNEGNNTQDTELGTVKGSKIEVPVSIKVSQYLGETITPYDD